MLARIGSRHLAHLYISGGLRFRLGLFAASSTSRLNDVVTMGRYAPPANTYPHRRHFQTPVEARRTAIAAHRGQACRCFRPSSIRSEEHTSTPVTDVSRMPSSA